MESMPGLVGHSEGGGGGAAPLIATLLNPPTAQSQFSLLFKLWIIILFTPITLCNI